MSQSRLYLLTLKIQIQNQFKSYNSIKVQYLKYYILRPTLSQQFKKYYLNSNFQIMQYSYKEESLPLIVYDQQTKMYQLTAQSKELLMHVPAPLAIVSVAGLYRTGKSYLLNRMILNKHSGFGVGSTVNACTKGLWVWGTPIKGHDKNGGNVNILVVDSEGIGALDEDQMHDTRIFSLAILLSSSFIYNSVGNIDENAIENLSLVVNITKNIQLKSSNQDEESAEDYQKFFPSFFWVIRDFSLQLIDQEGDEMTSNEYLEKSLVPQNGVSDQVENKNRIRRMIQQFFPERECITMVRPLLDEKQLQNLDRMDLSELRMEFFDQVMYLRKRVLERVTPKTMNGRQLSGEMFMNLALNYINSINNGGVPNIESGWQYICKFQNEKAFSSAVELLDSSIVMNMKNKMPFSNEEFKAQYKQIANETKAIFKKNAIGDFPLDQIIKEIKQRKKTLFQMNEKESYNHCIEYISQEFNSIEQKLKTNEYKTYDDYQKDVKLFNQFLNTHGPKVANSKTIYNNFYQKVLLDGQSHFASRNANNFEITQKNILNDLKETKDAKLSLETELVQLKSNYEQTEAQRTFLQSEFENIQQEFNFSSDNFEKIKNQMETHYMNELNQLQTKTTQEIDQLREKLEKQTQINQDLEKNRYINSSETQKELALLQHKLEHLTEQNSVLKKNEAKFNQQLLETTEEFQSKYRHTSETLNEKVDELRKQMSSQKEEFTITIETNSKSYQKLTQQFEELQVSNKTLKQSESEKKKMIISLEESVQKYQKEHQNNAKNTLSQMEQDLQNASLEGVQKQGLIKELEEMLKQTKNQIIKDNAIYEQKIEFKDKEINEVKIQLAEFKKIHEDTLAAIQLNESSQRTFEFKQLSQIKDQQDKDISQLNIQMENITKKFQYEFDELQQQIQDLEIDAKVHKQNIANQEDILRNKESIIIDLKLENENLQSAMDQNKLNHDSTLEIKYTSTIKQLQAELDKVKRDHTNEIDELGNNSKEQVQQLKSYYLIEKQRLEDKLLGEQAKNKDIYNQVAEEFESKMVTDQAQYEDDIENYKEDVAGLENQYRDLSQQYDHDMQLKLDSIDALEKQLEVSKEHANNLQFQNTHQQDQFNKNFQTEKDLLNEKINNIQSLLNKSQTENVHSNQKLMQIQIQLEKKDAHLVELKSVQNNDKSNLQEKLDAQCKKTQEVSDQYLEAKMQYEKQLALSTQQNKFSTEKIEKLEKLLEDTNNRYEERIKNLKQEYTLETHDKLIKTQEEKQSIELKFEILKKDYKESDQNNHRLITSLEKEKAIVTEKLQYAQQMQSDSSAKLQQEIENLTNTINLNNQNFKQYKVQSQQQIETLKANNQSLESQNHDLIANYEKDKALWEGKFNFLEQQKDQAKQDQHETLKKFEITMQHLTKMRQNDKQEQDNSNEMLIMNEKKYEMQINELNNNWQAKLQKVNDKQKTTEKELKMEMEKLILEKNNILNNVQYLEKKVSELMKSEQNYLNQLNQNKSLLQSKINEVQTNVEGEKDNIRQILKETEEKKKETEQKHRKLLYDFETEKIKWTMEREHLIASKNELIEQNQKIDKKKETLLQENAKMRQELTRGNKREKSMQQSFLNNSRTNIHHHHYSKKMEPSVANSEDQNDDNTYEPVLSNILDQFKGDNQVNMFSEVTTTFKSYSDRNSKIGEENVKP